MRIISRKKLNDYIQKRPKTKSSINTWYYEVKHASWKSSNDMMKSFPKAKKISGNKARFEIMGNKHRLVVAINYRAGIVYIRFIGTHKEYDNINAKEI